MINKTEFNKQKFVSLGIYEQKETQSANRVPGGWVPTNGNSIELRERIRDIVYDKSDEYRLKYNVKIGDFEVAELCCRIPVDTIKKAISGRYNITRNFLAKFSVGFKLGVEDAGKLFREHSGELNLTNAFDYIVYYALKTGDDIDFFMEELQLYLNINLDRDKL